MAYRSILACVAVTAPLLLLIWWRRSRALLRATPRREWPNGVEVRPSCIAGAGDGLFVNRRFEAGMRCYCYYAESPHSWRVVLAGEVLGEYRGRVLSLHQAMCLENR